MARPHGAKNRKTIVTAVAAERHPVIEQGKKKKRTTLEMVLLMMRNKALEGDLPSLKFLEKFEARQVPLIGKVKTGVLIAPRHETEEEWRERTERQQAKYRTNEYLNEPENPTAIQG